MLLNIYSIIIDEYNNGLFMKQNFFVSMCSITNID